MRFPLFGVARIRPASALLLLTVVMLASWLLAARPVAAAVTARTKKAVAAAAAKAKPAPATPPVAAPAANAAAATYYLAPAAAGGADTNNGLTAGSPWLSPNHPLNCGDVIVASASTAYDARNFDSGHWGTVSCAGNNNVAWLACASFDACKINSSTQGIYIDRSYWGVQGFEVSTSAGSNGFCFGAAPNYTHPAEVHHVIFANNIANGCQAGGFVVFNVGQTAGADYVSIVGNVVYDAARGGAQCYNGISIYQPVQSDSASGTHLFVAGNFAWANTQASTCGGVQAYGGDGIILDTLDGSNGGLAPYTAQAAVENNITVGNGGHGIEVQNNIAGAQHALIEVKNNTIWNNETLTTQQYNHLCAEFLINSGFNIRVSYNLVSASAPTACASNPMYAFSAYDLDGTVWLYDNFGYGFNNQNTYAYAYRNFQYDNNNILGQDPVFNAPRVPGAPSCSGSASVPQCMAGLVAQLAPANNAAGGTGYQKPTSQGYDPLFPQWLCAVNLPPGLVTRAC